MNAGEYSKFGRSVLGAAALMFSIMPSHADVAGWSITITPQNPATVESVLAKISKTCNDVFAQVSSLRQDGNTIRVVMKVQGGINCFGPISWDVSLGAFGAGDFSVIVSDVTGVQLTSASFTVKDSYAGKTAPFPLVNYADHWWNPQESGWGMSIAQHSSDLLFAVWFVYNNSNAPTWYTLQPGRWTNATTFTGPIYKTSGPFFGGNFDPNQVSITQVGTGTLSFDGYATGTFFYTVEGITGSKSITRLPF